jgi:hypothetical protein
LKGDEEGDKKKFETIVCYDSRSQDENGNAIRDSADKEVRYLIAKVAEKEPHILVVYDCCHSSSGTRDAKRKERIRQLATDTRPARAYAEFCFGHDSTISLGLKQGKFPEGKHIFMSACLYTKTAKEITVDGKSHGAFSYFLVKELESLNVALSYKDLLHEVSGRVRNYRRDQTPCIESIGISSEELSRLAFLGDSEVIKLRETYFNLSYRQETSNQAAEWLITGGASEFLEPGSELAVYPEDCPVEEMKNETKKLCNVRIMAIRLAESTVTFISEPEPSKESSYKAVLTKQSLPSVKFYMEGDAAALSV